MREHFNWIGGEPREAEKGLYFERFSAGPGPRDVERWPRSSAGDAARSIESCAYAAGRWSACGREERLRVLARVADELERDDLAPREMAAELGLDDDEFAPRHEEELYRLREALEILREGEEAQGVGFFQAHWSDLLGGLAQRVATHLLAGQTVVVLSDARLPCAAQALAIALDRAGAPRGVVAVVHDDTDTFLNAAALHPGLAWLRFKGVARRLETLQERHAARLAPHWSWWTVRARSQLVFEGDDCALEAARAVELSIGRASTLSAQFPGQTARILCHQRLFSKFTDELLARLEASPDARRPAPAIDADLDEHVHGAWELGLDEGATPLCGWDAREAARDLPPPDADGLARESAASVVRKGRGWPVVFTNVDARSRLAALSRPAPVLRLIRVPTDERARELARHLD